MCFLLLICVCCSAAPETTYFRAGAGVQQQAGAQGKHKRQGFYSEFCLLNRCGESGVLLRLAKRAQRHGTKFHKMTSSCTAMSVTLRVLEPASYI
jgi:hypothetical protein